jgi:phage protein D
MLAQTPIPIYTQQETFYVPAFEVRVLGKTLPSNVIRDVLQVTYKDSIDEVDSFEIEINNWDADQRTFKFAPPEKGFEDIFDPGQKIEVWMGYYGTLRRMMRGIITALEPDFSGTSAPTLNIRGQNELYQFTTEKHTYSWTDASKTDTDIAKYLCGLPVKKGRPGLGIQIDAHPAPNEEKVPNVFMKNQYDIVFLLERARRRGYELYIEDETKPPRLYWGLSANPGNVPVYQLEWGKSLISFRPTLSTAKQISEVIVRGWDRTANEPIEEHYTLEKLWKDLKLSQAEIARRTQLAKAFQNRTQDVDVAVFSKQEAQNLARSILNDTHNKMIEGSGSTVGLPDLRSGCNVEILGFGAQSDYSGNPIGDSSDFDGEYFVTSSTHTIGTNGYRTDFSARRQGPLTPRKLPQG